MVTIRSFFAALLCCMPSLQSFALTACVVTEVCEKCTEDGDDGTKLRLYEQHCKEQARLEGYDFLSYHSATVGHCDFIRSFKTDVSCEKIGGKPAN